MGVSKNRGTFSPQIIHFNRVFPYKVYPFWGTTDVGFRTILRDVLTLRVVRSDKTSVVQVPCEVVRSHRDKCQCQVSSERIWLWQILGPGGIFQWGRGGPKVQKKSGNLPYLAILLVTFLGWLSDLQLGDEKLTLNHLVMNF